MSSRLSADNTLNDQFEDLLTEINSLQKNIHKNTIRSAKYVQQQASVPNAESLKTNTSHPTVKIPAPQLRSNYNENRPSNHTPQVQTHTKSNRANNNKKSPQGNRPYANIFSSLLNIILIIAVFTLIISQREDDFENRSADNSRTNETEHSSNNSTTQEGNKSTIEAENQKTAPFVPSLPTPRPSEEQAVLPNLRNNSSGEFDEQSFPTPTARPSKQNTLIAPATRTDPLLPGYYGNETQLATYQDFEWGQLEIQTNRAGRNPVAVISHYEANIYVVPKIEGPHLQLYAHVPGTKLGDLEGYRFDPIALYSILGLAQSHNVYPHSHPHVYDHIIHVINLNDNAKILNCRYRSENPGSFYYSTYHWYDQAPSGVDENSLTRIHPNHPFLHVRHAVKGCPSKYVRN